MKGRHVTSACRASQVAAGPLNYGKRTARIPVSISQERLKNIYSKLVASDTVGEIHRGKQSGFACVKTTEVLVLLPGALVHGDTPVIPADVIEAVVVDVGDIEVPDRLP